MKRATFKKPFNGMDNALKLIPESYKVDGHEFEITDGVETYRVRWESEMNEGVVLRGENANLINEDMKKIKHLMGFKSQDTLGNLKGEERLNENSSFKTIWDKTKSLLSENEEEKETLTEMQSGSAGGLGFTGEGNLEGNSPIAEMEKEEMSEEVNEGDDVSALMDKIGDIGVLRNLFSKINTRPEKIEAATQYVKAIVGDDEALMKKVARGLMGSEVSEATTDLSPAQSEKMDTDKDGDIDAKDLENLRADESEKDRFDEIFEGYYEESLEEEDVNEILGFSKKEKFMKGIEQLENGTFIYSGNRHDGNARQGGIPSEPTKQVKGAASYLGGLKLNPKYSGEQEMLQAAEEDGYEGLIRVNSKDKTFFYQPSSEISYGSATAAGRNVGAGGLGDAK
jgi:hypothetical protein